MQDNQSRLSKFLVSGFLWSAGVWLFAFAPILFLHFIGWLSEEEVTEKELKKLNEVGYSIFICCAITGSVLMTFWRSRASMHTALGYFTVYLAPFFLLAYVFLKYLLVYIQYGSVHDFGPGARSTLVIIIFSALYTVIARTIYIFKTTDEGRFHL
jgi:hypothetical protein